MAQLFRVRTVFTAPQGSPWFSNHYFSGATIGGDPQDEIDAIEEFWSGFGGSLDNSISAVVEAEVPVIDDGTGNIISVSLGTQKVPVFSATGAPLPRSQQCLVQWLTSTFVGGRRTRGRTFIPGVMTANMNEGRPDPSVVAAYAAVAQALVTDGATELVVWRRPVEADPDADPPVEGRTGGSAPVTQATVWSEYAVLRSRRD